MSKDYAILASGCFWCTETIFDNVVGVVSVVPGYIGGKISNPKYEEICTGTTGHAEAVKIKYDTNIISFSKLLEIFFKTHDPTTLNRQGPDIGTQYRSVIYYYSEDQKNKSIHSKNEYAKSSGLNIVTEISEAKEFYKAEEYHQKYIQKTGLHCAI